MVFSENDSQEGECCKSEQAVAVNCEQYRVKPIEIILMVTQKSKSSNFMKMFIILKKLTYYGVDAGGSIVLYFLNDELWMTWSFCKANDNLKTITLRSKIFGNAMENIDLQNLCGITILLLFSKANCIEAILLSSAHVLDLLIWSRIDLSCDSAY